MMVDVHFPELKTLEKKPLTPDEMERLVTLSCNLYKGLFPEHTRPVEFSKKMELLGVPEAVISKDGVVSQATARLMAEGARRLLGSGVAISITGVAGPEEQDGKPVGLTYIGVSLDGTTQVREYHWPGGRATNRVASVEAAIELAADVLSSALR